MAKFFDAKAFGFYQLLRFFRRTFCFSGFELAREVRQGYASETPEWRAPTPACPIVFEADE
jgi:hypothetical protein